MSDKEGSDVLVSRLVDRLRMSPLSEGSTLPSETSLSAALGVGRQRIREALRVLESRGIVQSRQGARRRWVGPNLGHAISTTVQLSGSVRETVAELLEVRQALETSLLTEVMPLHSPSGARELLDLSHEMVNSANRGEIFMELDRRFHLDLFAPLGNTALEGILEAFWNLLLLIETPSSMVDADVEVARMHQSIIEAMIGGDYNLARHELEAHFYGVRRRVMPRKGAAIGTP